MSRPAQRNLTLTEELERLEQQITLTLQEIDSNFSKAHRTVTTSILPIVEEYAKHSNEVWEGSKFWKQFFEASANVSLSGYEENADETVTNTEATESFQTPTDQGDSTITGAEQHDGEDEEFSVESPTQMTGVQTTPKLPPSTARKTNGGGRGQTNRPASSYKSPTPRKYTGTNPAAMDDSSEQPSTPRMSTANLASSPFEPESGFKPSIFNSHQRQNNDPMMHRAILDKNYRIQATPHTQRQQRQQAQAQAQQPKATPATATKKAPWDDSPGSSPIAAPELRSELFSPAKGALRTPGLSVLTPAGKKGGLAPPKTSAGMELFSPQDKAYASTKDRTRASAYFDDSDEDDDLPEMSPPKTMQFHLPQSRLMQTPAREASKKIVDDLLLTAGADATDDIEGGDDDLLFDEPSPSVVKRAYDMEDDTF